MSTTDLPLARAERTEARALILSALAAVFWGTNFEATRIALGELSPWSAAGGRFGLAAALMLAWLAASGRLNLRVLRRNLPAYVGLGLIGIAGFNAALFVGMQTSSPVTAALIMATSPLTTSLIDAGINRRWPKLVALAGMALSLIGVAFTVGAFSGTRFAPGDLLILGGSVAWAVYSIGCRRWVIGASALETSVWTMVLGALALVAAAFAYDNPLQAYAHIGADGLGALLYMAIAGSVLAYAFWQVGIAVRGPAATAILFNLVPVAALFVAAGSGRMPTLTQLGGVAIAILGVLVASETIGLPGRTSRPATMPGTLRSDAGLPPTEISKRHWDLP